MFIERSQLVRRLLGAATQLFLDDADPIIVHCIASSAVEHAELLAQDANRNPLKQHILSTFPEISEQEFKRLRNQNWNVIKHSHDRKGQPFDVPKKLADFDDWSNDAILFAGWHDYQRSGQPLPIEAQAFQVWFFNLYPNSVDPTKRSEVAYPSFENLTNLSRIGQKTALREAIETARNDTDIMNHPNTDKTPLNMQK